MKNSEIKILLVDDEPDVLEGFKEYLEELYDYNIETATNAGEALKRLKEDSFEVVITDMRMENNDSGFDVLNAVNKKQLTTFVIILTANSSVEGCRKAWKCQAWDYISKTNEEPNPLDEVHESIQDVMVHLDKWNGHLEDKSWVEEHIETLSKEYINQYIAVLHREVVAFASKKSELIEKLLDRKISPYLAYTESFKLEVSSEKFTVFVEGVTDIDYLNKTIEIFGRDDLKEKIEITVVGEKKNQGNEGNGESNLKNAFTFLKNNPESRGEKGTLFLFDNDVIDKKIPNKGKAHENVYVARMGEYLANNSGVSGIESFFDIELYEEGFKKGWISKTVKHSYVDGNLNEDINYKISDKVKFADWVIENRATKEVFSRFDGVLSVIDGCLD